MHAPSAARSLFLFFFLLLPFLPRTCPLRDRTVFNNTHVRAPIEPCPLLRHSCLGALTGDNGVDDDEEEEEEEEEDALVGDVVDDSVGDFRGDLDWRCCFFSSCCAVINWSTVKRPLSQHMMASLASSSFKYSVSSFLCNINHSSCKDPLLGRYAMMRPSTKALPS